MRRRRAFTLMEAALVLFLMGFLSVTATASFNGWRTQSADREAQGTADSALDALLQVALVDGAVSASPQRLAEESSRLNWVAGDATPVERVDVSAAASSRFQRVAVAVVSRDGTCWMARHDLLGPVSGTPRLYVVVADSARLECQAEVLMTLVVDPGDRGSSWRTPYVVR